MSGLELKRGRDWGRESAAKLDRIMTFMTNHRAFKRLKRPCESFGNRFRQRKIVSISIAMFSHSAMPTAPTFCPQKSCFFLVPSRCTFLKLAPHRGTVSSTTSTTSRSAVQFFPLASREGGGSVYPFSRPLRRVSARESREGEICPSRHRAAGRRPNTS